MPKYEMSDVIVLLPGIPGSVLRKFGRIVWGYDATTIGMALFTHRRHLSGFNHWPPPGLQGVLQSAADAAH